MLNLRQDRRGDRMVTIIESDDADDNVMTSLTEMVQQDAEGQRLLLDVGRMAGLNDAQRRKFAESVVAYADAAMTRLANAADLAAALSVCDLIVVQTLADIDQLRSEAASLLRGCALKV